MLVVWENKTSEDAERMSVLKTKLETVALCDYVDESNETLPEFDSSDGDDVDEEH